MLGITFNVEFFTAASRSYIRGFIPMLYTSWTRMLDNGLNIHDPPHENEKIQIGEIILDWWYGQPHSLLGRCGHWAYFPLLALFAGICALLAIVKIALWLAALVPAHVIFLLFAFEITRLEKC